MTPRPLAALATLTCALSAVAVLGTGARAVDPVPPAPLRVGPALLAGTEVQVPYMLSEDSGTTGVRWTRTSPGRPSRTGTSSTGDAFTDDGLDVGATYTYDVRAVRSDGTAGLPAVLTLVATAPPTLGVPDLTTSTSATLSFPVQVAAAGNAASTRYSVDQRSAPGAWTRWLTRSTETGPVSFRSAGTARTYELRGQAVDPFGNATRPVLSRRAVVPLDDTQLYPTGSTLSVPRAGSYGGSATFLRAAGATVTHGLVGDRMQVIGERCPTCGALDVYVDRVRVARVDSRASTRSVRQVLWSRELPGYQQHLVAVRAVGTPGRPTVVVDAFANRRYLPPAGASLTSLGELRRGDSLTATDGSHRLSMQLDGNVVLYDDDGRPLWNTATDTGTRFVLQAGGNLVLLDASGNAIWQTATDYGDPTTLLVQRDGNLVLYRDRGYTPVWSSRAGRIR